MLITAAVLGICCAKAKDFDMSDLAASPLLAELNFYLNQTHIIKAKEEAQAALIKERANHLQIKQEVNLKRTFVDKLQGKLETLKQEITILESNKTNLEKNCGWCMPGWIFQKRSCYYFSDEEVSSKKNWTDSRNYCMSKGGDLLVINNLEEQQLIRTHLPRRSSSHVWWLNGFWIGLTDAVTQGVWMWVNNVTETSTAYWRTGQPSHFGSQTGNCVAFLGDTLTTWYNANCNQHRLNWICEKEASKTDVV
ncbi:perlucin-like protein [Oryzias melastigma]|uniref:Perlucin-like protein n=1 Tax=Oryzias melastigma TaxID=30732 RepID=A0A3B3DWN2_ORYME|nr:perlucin-like protein [Oryzias melastigma]